MGGERTEPACRWRSALAATAAACVLVGSAAPAAPAATAPPARPAEVHACQVQTTEAAKTADIPQPVSGVGKLGGCVADTSGIAHLLLTWESNDDGSHGRICTDPSVIDNAWVCIWDTTGLPRGAYTVHMVAIDEAGNRGTFDRAYEVIAPPERDLLPSGRPVPEPTVAPREAPPADAAPDAPAEPGPAPEVSEPAPVLPQAGETPPPPSEVLPVEPDPVALARTLALARLAACAQDGVEGAETDAVEVVSQVDQAAVVRDCVAPALEAFGATGVEVDALPVPPQLWVVFADEVALRTALPDLPSSVAGVPLRIMTAEQRDQLVAERAADSAPEPAG